jgi:DNA modification methylase
VESRIICGDALEELRRLPAEIADSCITSPPYWGLRDYGVEGQLGLEKTPEEYVAKLVEVFREVKRVLRSDGTLWLNLGDSYWGSRCGPSGNFGVPDGLRVNNSRGKIYADHEILKPKDLVGIPWRVAFALQADGWWLRSDIIWSKPNPMPESVRDRPTRSHEYIFLLSKSAKYYFDQEAVAEPHSRDWSDGKCGGSLVHAPRYQKNSLLKGAAGEHRGEGPPRMNPLGRNIRSVWTMTTKPMPKIFGAEHFATFPPELPERCIKAGCPKGGIVLDPFFGAGTVGVVAKSLGRRWIGIELNPLYAAMAEARVRATGYQMKIEEALDKRSE